MFPYSPMELHIGETYKLSTSRSNSFREEETFTNERSDSVIVETLWRSVLFLVTICDEKEKLFLETCSSKEAIGEIDLSTLSDIQFDESRSEYARNIRIDKMLDEGRKLCVYKNARKNGPLWLLENGFYSDDVNYFLRLPLKLMN